MTSAGATAAPWLRVAAPQRARFARLGGRPSARLVGFALLPGCLRFSGAGCCLAAGSPRSPAWSAVGNAGSAAAADGGWRVSPGGRRPPLSAAGGLRRWRMPRGRRRRDGDSAAAASGWLPALLGLLCPGASVGRCLRGAPCSSRRVPSRCLLGLPRFLARQLARLGCCFS